MRKPVIAAVSGYAVSLFLATSWELMVSKLGGGCELAMMCVHIALFLCFDDHFSYVIVLEGVISSSPPPPRHLDNPRSTSA